VQGGAGNGDSRGREVVKRGYPATGAKEAGKRKLRRGVTGKKNKKLGSKKRTWEKGGEPGVGYVSNSGRRRGRSCTKKKNVERRGGGGKWVETASMSNKKKKRQSLKDNKKKKQNPKDANPPPNTPQNPTPLQNTKNRNQTKKTKTNHKKTPQNQNKKSCYGGSGVVTGIQEGFPNWRRVEGLQPTHKHTARRREWKEGKRVQQNCTVGRAGQDRGGRRRAP